MSEERQTDINHISDDEITLRLDSDGCLTIRQRNPEQYAAETDREEDIISTYSPASTRKLVLWLNYIYAELEL